MLANQLYGPYGTSRYSGGSMASYTDKGYTGQYADTLTGLDYYNARYYDPTVGVFLSADTVQGKNPYAYVGGNPETNIDPTGEMMCSATCGDGGSSSGDGGDSGGTVGNNSNNGNGDSNNWNGYDGGRGTESEGPKPNPNASSNQNLYKHRYLNWYRNGLMRLQHLEVIDPSITLLLICWL